MANSKNFTIKIKQFEIWLADLPRFGIEIGKTRPVPIVPTDLLNKFHPSTIICPITATVKASDYFADSFVKGICKIEREF